MTTYSLVMLQHFFSSHLISHAHHNILAMITKKEIICINIQDEGVAVTEKFYFYKGLQEFKNLSALWDNSKSKILSKSIEMQPQQSVQ